MKVFSEKDAWDKADKLMKYGYTHDEFASKRAGYPIYMSNKPNSNAHISDLGDRLEVNLDNGKSVNIWIETLSDYDKETISEILDDFIYGVEDKIDSDFCEISGLEEMRKMAYEIGKKFLGW